MAVNPARVECQLGNGTLILETGKFAKQAHGSVMVRFGDTAVLCAAVFLLRFATPFFVLALVAVAWTLCVSALVTRLSKRAQ